MSKVTIASDENGNIVIPSSNPEFGYVRVEQFTNQINDEGWLRIVKRSALIKGKMEDLLDQEYSEGQELTGKIIVKESLYPFYEEDPERNLKMAGDTGIVCRLGDQPIYRQTFFTTNLTAQDEFITHTNSDEIREKMASKKAASKGATQTRFKLLRDRKIATTKSRASVDADL